MPKTKTITAVCKGEMSRKPELRPIAAESSESANERAAASLTDRDSEQSQSAQVSSRYRRMPRPMLFIFMQMSPDSERCLIMWRRMLLKTERNPIEQRTTAPIAEKSF